MLWPAQSDMQEGSASKITLHVITGSVLTLMISHMYGTLSRIPDKELPALFMAADAHQVQAVHINHFIKGLQWLRWCPHTSMQQHMCSKLSVIQNIHTCLHADGCLSTQQCAMFCYTGG